MRLWHRIGLLLALVLTLGGCDIAKIKDLSVASVGVKYLVPTSARSMDAVLLLGLDNPSISFTVQDVKGVVKYYDREMVHFTAGALPVQARSVQVYELPCTAVLDDQVSLLDMMALAAKRSLDGLTVDVKLRVSLRGGKGTELSFKDIDLTQFSQ